MREGQGSGSETWLDIPTGRFRMGRDLDDDDPMGEGPARDVTVGRLLLAGSPLSVESFGAFVTATGYETIAEREGSGFASVDEPDLLAGASWRLPTGPKGAASQPHEPAVQLSWMDAFAYAGWAGDRFPTEAEWEYAASLGYLSSGDLFHWCADWFDSRFHRDEQRVNPTGPTSGTTRLVKGGRPTRTARLGRLPDFCAADLVVRLVSVRR